MQTEAAYLWDQILRHARLFFSTEAFDLLRTSRVRFLPLADALAARESGIIIPTGVPTASRPGEVIEGSFGKATIRLWSRMPPPDSAQWTALGDPDQPLWYRNSAGALMPSWSLYDTLFDLLCFREEATSERRDCHGRFAGAFSPRNDAGLLEEPIFNDAVALLVGAVLGLRDSGAPVDRIADHVRPARVVLSHDCDLLRGNDAWTQLVRLYRVVEPIRRARLPRLQNLWWAARNAVRPRDFYFDNIRGIIALERMFGCRSIFYLINGSGGRFGARSGAALIPDAVSAVPGGWELGIHYNYDTHLSRERLETQLFELEALVGRKITCGRAHYLRFDAARSFSLYRDCGIEVDESAGYTDRIGYRCGIAGGFQPWNEPERIGHALVEVPMTVMEATLVAQYRDAALSRFDAMLRHLKTVGGALTLVLHPGQFFNPELPVSRHFYHRLLQSMRSHEAVGETAAQLARDFRNDLPR